MKILFVVSECVPFAKSGGLADVAGALPKELKRLGTDVRVILPKYGTISEHYKQEMAKVAEFIVPVGWRQQYCGIEMLKLDGVTYYFVDNEYYFYRDGMYGFYDDGERFSYFTRAVLDAIAHLSFYPDVIHCHDWHTGMVPLMLRFEHQKRRGYEFIKTVFTIHNLQFQGIFPKQVLSDLLNLDDRCFQPHLAEFYGNINFMKAGLVASDFLTTVSPTYCSEILTPYYGEKLDGVLTKRIESFRGILNGIDEHIYNPRHDPTIDQQYDFRSIGKKIINKTDIQQQLGFETRPDVPLMIMISRLTKQKGIDLIKGVFHEMMESDIQLIILGTGDAEYEHFFGEMAQSYPQKVRTIIGFDEGLAHRLYAAADLFLMPSQFEPCGLGQLIAMKYGAIPIVRETGGLNDTVQAFNEYTGEGNGFSFANFNAHDMLYTYRRAIYFYHEKETWEKIVQNAMKQDYSWAQSAFKYNDLYADLVIRSESHVF
ncbi:glycogen synthase GlgA [Falsibacillus albus]|uniref:Glycogen synthase n=1 Tax=Falsibacillus albus TaxID=2478915 RepID=A0A3L7K410_9BACI|nr:glycogen synthase GlgA [Falsibacillus albus]RLQ97836.1 glycogen synthase GlgA [Falsibacillus albus]